MMILPPSTVIEIVNTILSIVTTNIITILTVAGFGLGVLLLFGLTSSSNPSKTLINQHNYRHRRRN